MLNPKEVLVPLTKDNQLVVVDLQSAQRKNLPFKFIPETWLHFFYFPETNFLCLT